MTLNILLTGGSGFIGKNLFEYLSHKHEVFAPTHQELELLDEDSVRTFFEKHDIDVVIHAAVRPGHRNAKDPTNQFYNNMRMFFNIVRNADMFQKMIFISSGSLYDMRYYEPKMKEQNYDNHIPIDELGLSKYISAKYIEKVENIVELRVFGIYGKYEDYAIRFISNTICKTLFDLPITIKQNRRFDYLYIDDLMPIIDYFLENKGKYKSYNVTPDETIELKILAERIRNISEKNLPIYIAQDGMGMEYSGDNSRLHKEIPEIKFTSIDDGMYQLYQWYKKNIHLINKKYLLFDK